MSDVQGERAFLKTAAGDIGLVSMTVKQESLPLWSQQLLDTDPFSGGVIGYRVFSRIVCEARKLPEHITKKLPDIIMGSIVMLDGRKVIAEQLWEVSSAGERVSFSTNLESVSTLIN